MRKLRIKQRTIEFDTGKETIIDVNGCSVVYVVWVPYNGNFSTSGYMVKSFIGDDRGEIVAKAPNWTEARRKGREYAKANFHRHAAKHNLAL